MEYEDIYKTIPPEQTERLGTEIVFTEFSESFVLAVAVEYKAKDIL